MPPVSRVESDVTTGSGGLLEVSLIGTPVPPVIMMLVTWAPIPEESSALMMK